MKKVSTVKSSPATHSRSIAQKKKDAARSAKNVVEKQKESEERELTEEKINEMYDMIEKSANTIVEWTNESRELVAAKILKRIFS